mgnify:CR=1 FL=1
MARGRGRRSLIRACLRAATSRLLLVPALPLLPPPPRLLPRLAGHAPLPRRERKALGAEAISIAADVGVKHALRPDGFDLSQAAKDVALRGQAGAVIVTGAATGAAADLQELQVVRDAVPSTPVLVGSGVDENNIGAILDIADGVIVGTSLKKAGGVTSPVDVERVKRLVDAAGS